MKKQKEQMIKFIRDYFKENNLGGVVIGISGGKDSAVSAALFTEALGSENVKGYTLPCHSTSTDKTDAELIAKHYNFELDNIDLTKVFDTFKEEIFKLGNFTEEELLNSDINLKPRLRMATLYYMAPLLSAIYNKTFIVVGNGNKCESYVGYYTKGGDNIADIKMLEDLTVDEVIELGEELNVPKEVLYKAPSDGLSGKTDEDKLGVTYKDIAKYINGEEVEEKAKQKIKTLHNNSKHKVNIPTYKKY